MEKRKKTIIVGIVLIFITLGSTFAYSFVQSIITKPTTGSIVDYALTSAQENSLIQNNLTILKFYYGLTCSYCDQQRSFLDGLMSSNDYSNQLFLERILTNATEPNLAVVSAYGAKSLVNATDYQILGALCDVMIFPLSDCALRKV